MAAFMLASGHPELEIKLLYHCTLYRGYACAELLSCVRLYDPIDCSPPGSPVPGILQAGHWSGLPFPSPMHESEKWKGSCSVVSDSSRPYELQPTRLLHPWGFPGKSTGVGCHCLLHRSSYNALIPKHFKRTGRNLEAVDILLQFPISPLDGRLCRRRGEPATDFNFVNLESCW